MTKSIFNSLCFEKQLSTFEENKMIITDRFDPLFDFFRTSKAEKGNILPANFRILEDFGKKIYSIFPCNVPNCLAVKENTEFRAYGGIRIGSIRTNNFQSREKEKFTNLSSSTEYEM